MRKHLTPVLGFSVFCLLLTICLDPLFAPPIPSDARVGGFGLGAQAYTFNRFSVFEAIEKTAQAGGKTIEFFPGQKLTADDASVKWDHHASAEVIQKVKTKLAQHKIVAVNY